MSVFDLVRVTTQPGMTAVDIGANLGGVTAALVQRASPGGRVYAIEPCPWTVDTGRALVPEATWLQCAIGASTGPGAFYLSADHRHNTCWAANAVAPTGAIQVPIVTLDQLQTDGLLPAQIDVIKVDTQGGESAVLRGATGLLRQHRTAWILELWPVGLQRAGASLEQLIAQCQAAALTPLGSTWDAIREAAQQIQSEHGSFDVVVVPA